MEPESDGDTNCNWDTCNNPQSLAKETSGHGNKRTNGDTPDYSIIKIEQNTEKSPRDLRRLAVTQSPGVNHQLMLIRKTLKRLR